MARTTPLPKLHAQGGHALAAGALQFLPADPSLVGLKRALRAARGQMPEDALELIEQILVYAALSEMRLAAQARRIDELESLSVTDELTGLLNRRGLLEALERTLANARRHGERGLVAYIDLDGFKQINDHFGHAAGDSVLYQVGAIIRASIRRTDYAARLAGDEFVILFTRTAAGAEARVLDELRARLCQRTLTVDGTALSVSASIGLAPYGPDSAAIDVLAHADRAMYREKQRRLTCAA
jgi:diguanylate cyclase (GGDEF)-like protein